MDGRSSAEWGEVLAGLERDKAAVEAELAGVEAEARLLALPASTGDRKAAGELAALDGRREGFARHVATLRTAIADATGLRDAALAGEAVERDAARLAQLREASAAQVELAGEVDTAARALAAAFNRYGEGVEVLRRLGLESSRYGKLRNKTMLSGAMHLAGLAGSLPLQSVSPSFRETMEGWCARMLAPVLLPEEAPAVWPPVPVPGLPLLAEAGQDLEPDETRDERGRVVVRSEVAA